MAYVAIVDQDIDIKDAICSVLSSFGYDCVLLTEAAEALSYITTHPYLAAVLADVSFPAPESMKALGELFLRKNRVAIIAMSSFDNRPAHVDGFLRKPFTLEDLVKVLGDVLTLGQMSDTAGR